MIGLLIYRVLCKLMWIHLLGEYSRVKNPKWQGNYKLMITTEVIS